MYVHGDNKSNIQKDMTFVMRFEATYAVQNAWIHVQYLG